MTYPHTATLQRKSRSNGKYEFADNGSTECFLQPLDDQASQIVGITFGKGSRCYVPLSTDIQEGDRMTINGIVYGVKGYAEHNYGDLAHKRVLLEQL